MVVSAVDLRGSGDGSQNTILLSVGVFKQNMGRVSSPFFSLHSLLHTVSYERYAVVQPRSRINTRYTSLFV